MEPQKLKKFTIENIYLKDDFSELEYDPFKINKTGIKFGQRKLALSLLQFVTLYCIPENLKKEGTKKYVVVYAGAAHGDNIAFISKLRPDIVWHLYDPGVFNIESITGVIEIYDKKHETKGFFTNKEAKRWRDINDENQNIFFISDIRTKNGGNYKQERNIYEFDMEIQKKWVQIIKPVKAQLKFRLPFHEIEKKKRSNRYVSYLPGTNYFGMWTGESTEGRLVPTSYTEDVWYDIEKHERQFSWYNYMEKYEQEWKVVNLSGGKSFKGIPGTSLITDRDSAGEIFTWSMYLIYTFGKKEVTENNIRLLAGSLSSALGNRTLKYLRKKEKEKLIDI